MARKRKDGAPQSDVAMWHELSGLPDNVTEDGEVVRAAPGQRLQAEKQQLRSAIDELATPGRPQRTRDLVRLAASYLLAGDVETARRYVENARQVAQDG